MYIDEVVFQVTKRVDTSEEEWRGWNWRSEGDIMANGAFFVASGQGVEVKYEKAYSVEPKSAAYIDQITLNAGVLGNRSFYFLPLAFTLLSFFSFPVSAFCSFSSSIGRKSGKG